MFVLCGVMYFAIQFYTESQFWTIEIKNIGTETMLLSEPITVQLFLA